MDATPTLTAGTVTVGPYARTSEQGLASIHRVNRAAFGRVDAKGAL